MRAVLVLALVLILGGYTRGYAQEREWTTDQTDTDAYLVFGVPESDDVGVSFWCKMRSDIIRFYAPETDAKLKPANRVPFTLEVPPKSFRFKGKTSPNEEAASIGLESEMKASDPVFAALQSSKYFSVKVGKDKQTYPLQESNFAAFVQVCKGP